MNARVGLAGNHDLSASVSFNTLRTHSPSSFNDSSSDLDTEVFFSLCFSFVVCLLERLKIKHIMLGLCWERLE